MPPLQYGDILQLCLEFVECRLARGLAEKKPPADDGFVYKQFALERFLLPFPGRALPALDLVPGNVSSFFRLMPNRANALRMAVSQQLNSLVISLDMVWMLIYILF